jgi:hypothetical protein
MSFIIHCMILQTALLLPLPFPYINTIVIVCPTASSSSILSTTNCCKHVRSIVSLSFFDNSIFVYWLKPPRVLFKRSCSCDKRGEAHILENSFCSKFQRLSSTRERERTRRREAFGFFLRWKVISILSLIFPQLIAQIVSHNYISESFRVLRREIRAGSEREWGVISNFQNLRISSSRVSISSN